jgi:hypothetical protein
MSSNLPPSPNGPQLIPKSLPPSSLQEKAQVIVAYLQQMSAPSMWNRELTLVDYEIWDKILSGYSIAAISFAFENWLRAGRKFPTPADIEPQCISYCEQELQNSYPKPHRGRSLTGGHAEILGLWACVNERMEDFRKQERTYIPMRDSEIDAMIDAVRSGYTPPVSGTATHFPNGNAKYNHVLTQARALAGVR